MEGMLADTGGQSTLEFALVMFALLASIVALGAVVGFLRDPSAFEAVISSSAHALAGSDPLGTMQDLAVF